MFGMSGSPGDRNWHDLIDRLWRDIDTTALSAEYQEYQKNCDALGGHLAKIPPGHHSYETDVTADRLGVSIERLKQQIMDRMPAQQTDVIEKALVIRDEIFAPHSIAMAQPHARDLAKLLASVIALEWPPLRH